MTSGGREPDAQIAGATLTKLAPDSGSVGRWVTELEVPAQLAPLTLAFRLRGGTPQGSGAGLGSAFTVPVGMGPGDPLPLGVSRLPPRPDPVAPLRLQPLLPFSAPP